MSFSGKGLPIRCSPFLVPAKAVAHPVLPKVMNQSDVIGNGKMQWHAPIGDESGSLFPFGK
jgi:hypothetical protein